MIFQLLAYSSMMPSSKLYNLPRNLNVLQLYRVNVILQPPDASEAQLAKTPFFVLRRYNQFRQLYEQVSDG